MNRSSQMVSSPSQKFPNSFQPLSNSAAASQFNRSMPGNNNVGLSVNTKPEKLFSPRHLNQRGQNAITNSQKNIPSMSNANNNSTTMLPMAGLPNSNVNNTSGAAPLTTTSPNAATAIPTRLGNGHDMDSDGSEHSQLSNNSKLSSNSVLSGQSEHLKGANKINTATKQVSSLTLSDGNRYTTVATNATSTTTTTTLYNNNNNNNNLNNNTNNIANSNQTLPGGVDLTLNSLNPHEIMVDPNLSPTQAQIQYQQQLLLLQQQQPHLVANKAKAAQAAANVTATATAEKTDGTLSDSALTNQISSVPETGGNKKRRPSMAKALVILGLSKKSNSASNLAYGKLYLKFINNLSITSYTFIYR